jgi:hypothetical protein
MSKKSRRNDNRSTSSGQGALGMGGQPNDNPRDEAGGHEGVTNDDRTRQVGGASGSGIAGRTPKAANNVEGDKKSLDADKKGRS